MFSHNQLLLLTTTALLTTTTLAQKCTLQSCEIAKLSGSTGLPFTTQLEGEGRPKGGSKQGTACIKNYWQKYGGPGKLMGEFCGPGGGAGAAPATAGGGSTSSSKGGKLGKLGKGKGGGVGGAARTVEEEFLQKVNLPTGDVLDMLGLDDAEGALVSPASKLEKRQKGGGGGCKPYTLLFARGTTESGTMGSTVGPALQRGLNSAQPGKWSVQGVSYTADIAGDNCIGLPGGFKCKDQLNRKAQACPSTKFIVSGYSQGAMVAHVCVAFASEQARKQVAGVVVFGDPFNGAPIKGFPSDKIKTYCAKGDGVCKGQFVISAAHLSYTGAPAKQAVQWISKAVQS